MARGAPCNVDHRFALHYSFSDWRRGVLSDTGCIPLFLSRHYQSMAAFALSWNTFSWIKCSGSANIRLGTGELSPHPITKPAYKPDYKPDYRFYFYRPTFFQIALLSFISAFLHSYGRLRFHTGRLRFTIGVWLVFLLPPVTARMCQTVSLMTGTNKFCYFPVCGGE